MLSMLPLLLLAGPLAVAKAQAVPADFTRDLQLFYEHLEQHPRVREVEGEPRWWELRDALEARLGEEPPLSLEEFAIELMRILALFQDGHSAVVPSQAIVQREGLLPVRFEHFADGLFITATAPEHASLLGAGVTALGGETLAEVERRGLELIGGDNEHRMRQTLAEELRRVFFLRAIGLAPLGTLQLSVESDGLSEEVELVGERELVGRGIPADWPRALDLRSPDLAPGIRNAGVDHWFELLDDGTLWVRHEVVLDEPDLTLADFTAQVFEQFDRANPARVVIDIRRNGGGNNYLNQPLIHGLIARPELSRSPGRLFVAIGPWTYSAAMCLAVEIERNTDAIFVGEPTGASVNHWGDAVTRGLPCGIALRISALHWQNSDPRDQRTALEPDLPAPLTFATLLAGQDPALAAVRALDPASAASLVAPNPNQNWSLRIRR